MSMIHNSINVSHLLSEFVYKTFAGNTNMEAGEHAAIRNGDNNILAGVGSKCGHLSDKACGFW